MSETVNVILTQKQIEDIAHDYEPPPEDVYFCRECDGEWKPETPPQHAESCWVGKALLELKAKEGEPCNM